ncbi:MAG: dTDP-4-amino-4,6-dideoxygalactose transaminase [Desulfoferrobacter sp.]
MDIRVPFNRCFLVGNEFEYIRKAIDGMHISGDGIFTRKCCRFLEQSLEVPKVLLTTSCTHALEMAAILLNIGPGDEFIVPSFTFVSTVNAFVLRGARPVFIDIRQDTLNMDETQLERYISARTKAIVPVHYAGVSCEMDKILQVARNYEIAVIEDNAHGLFGRYKQKYLGTLGCMATQSFHETKNFTCGEGGALIINEAKYIERAEIIREKGTNRSRFFRGEVDKYTWVDIGSSFLPSDILAAFLWAQLESRESIQEKRRWIWNFYNSHLQEWASEKGIQIPIVPSECEQPYHMYYLILHSIRERQALMQYLRQRGISTVFHYVPLHLSRMGREFGYREGDFPVTERVSESIVRLPFHNYLTADDLAYVVKTLREFEGIG